jgi:hypothetical protein
MWNETGSLQGLPFFIFSSLVGNDGEVPPPGLA